MNEERKDQIGRKFLLSPYILIEECSELEIQELIFLIHSGKHFKAKGAFPVKQLDERISLLFGVLKEKVQNAETLYIAYEKSTNYPYIDADDRIWLFSKEEYAAKAADYFMQQLLMLEMKSIDKEDIMRTLAEFHMLGLRKILVDNGQHHIELDRDELLSPPDFSNTPEINIPVTNPNLQHAIIRFFQFIGVRRSGEGAKQLGRQLEAQMLDEVIRAKYLVPMKLQEKEPSVPDEQGRKTIKEGTTIQVAVLSGEGDSKWLPAFTDWKEFEKAYDKRLWSSNVATYDDILALSENMNGVVINCRGIPLTIHEKNKQMISEFRKARDAAATTAPNANDTSNEAPNEAPSEAPSEAPKEVEVPKEAASETEAPSSAGSVNEVIIPKETTVLIGDPKEIPEQMLGAIKDYLKQQKGVKKAYLKWMVKGEEQSYLLIVDFEGNQDELFRGIAQAATPHLNGLLLDIVGTDGWAAEHMKDAAPFYKKKRFGFI